MLGWANHLQALSCVALPNDFDLLTGDEIAAGETIPDLVQRMPFAKMVKSPEHIEFFDVGQPNGGGGHFDRFCPVASLSPIGNIPARLIGKILMPWQPRDLAGPVRPVSNRVRFFPIPQSAKNLGAGFCFRDVNTGCENERTRKAGRLGASGTLLCRASTQSLGSSSPKTFSPIRNMDRVAWEKPTRRYCRIWSNRRTSAAGLRLRIPQQLASASNDGSRGLKSISY